MKIITWNVRGLSAPDKKRLIKRALHRVDSDIVLLQETKLCLDKALSFLHSYNNWEGFFHEARGTAGGLGVMWNPHNIKMTELESLEYWLFGAVRSLRENVTFLLINVYGLIKIEEKAKVWKDITQKIDSLNNDRVSVAGDFNALLDLEEKRGGMKISNKVMEDFRDFVMLNHLFGVIPKNGSFTWTNRRVNFANISERLDRFLVGPFWLDSAFHLDSCILPFSLSDHFPDQLSFKEANKSSRGSFRFQGMSNEEFVREKQLKSELSKVFLREEIYWRDNLRECWIKEGDLNTKIFHASIKAKRANSRISYIQDRLRVWQEEAETIEDITVNHFKALLGEGRDNTPQLSSSMLDVINRVVSVEDNEQLMRPFTLQEIKKATFDNPPFKAPGPDGVTTKNFQKCWAFIGEDIFKVAEYFRRIGKFVREMNNMVIVLIPKKQECSTMMDFRSISLCNSLYKIMSKAMVNRLKPLLKKIISDEQHDFFPGREIMDSIILAGETIHSMHSDKKQGDTAQPAKRRRKLDTSVKVEDASIAEDFEDAKETEEQESGDEGFHMAPHIVAKDEGEVES
ncbi:uncharacterized protein LOC131033064 [Cryptomeria japonica]|uniref:uncharacterized protein LOC131033064 n=1 Tax=Cryptomeria japonica TaxID=3369 RepID=UPI0027DA6805|nr:uncharacterized protein LOC131033064 [Cryptomeria japonica]